MHASVVDKSEKNVKGLIREQVIRSCFMLTHTSSTSMQNSEANTLFKFDICSLSNDNSEYGIAVSCRSSHPSLKVQTDRMQSSLRQPQRPAKWGTMNFDQEYMAVRMNAQKRQLYQYNQLH